MVAGPAYWSPPACSSSITETALSFDAYGLQSVRLEHIVNFAHVRHIFFSGALHTSNSISPFISVVFEKSASVPSDSRFQYWSAKRTALVENIRAVVLNRGDMHWARTARLPGQ